MGFSKTLIYWYEKNKRDLPFRKTKDPYRIWLSEIILQQTRVSQGLPYYERFVTLFPTVHHLAKAKEGVVMKAWQGLGYYSRARNLHHTAQYVSTRLKGKFPSDFEEIKKLKGIGDYTAGAIASLAFNKPHVVVDGNVFRVLSRYFGIRTAIDSSEGKKVFTLKAKELLDKKDPGTFNQAVMEFGALQCVPQNPDCQKCPLKSSCKAFRNDLVDLLPVKAKKTKARNRYFNYLVIRENENLSFGKGKLLIKKRTEKDIWKNLYDFPLIETNKPVSKNELLKHLPLSRISDPITFKHLLSHQTIFARFWKASLKKIKSVEALKGSVYINESQLSRYAFPRLIERYIDGNMRGK